MRDAGAAGASAGAATGQGRADTRAGAVAGADGAASGRSGHSGAGTGRDGTGRSGVVDSPELVRVRALLYALRPDPRGAPLGWGPHEKPPATEEPRMGALAARIRVQTSPEVPAILPGAFASRAGVTAGTRAVARIAALAQVDPEAGQALGWLQRHGTLADGLGALYESAALALADAETREGWSALDPARRAPARRGYGRRRVLGAAERWWTA